MAEDRVHGGVEWWREHFTKRHPSCLFGCDKSGEPGFGWTNKKLAEEVLRLRGEVTRMQRPLEGDIEGQAMAWRDVCEILAKIGLHEFIGTELLAPYRQRVIEFIEHLGKNQKASGAGAEIDVWPS